MKKVIAFLSLLFAVSAFAFNESSSESVSYGLWAGSNSYGQCATTLGYGAGGNEAVLVYSEAIGYAAGQEAAAEYSVMVGNYAGNSSKVYGSVLLGNYAGVFAGTLEDPEDVSQQCRFITGVGSGALAYVRNAHLVGAFGHRTLLGASNVSNVMAIGHNLGVNTSGFTNRVWIDCVPAPDPDNSAIVVKPQELILGRTGQDVVIRGNITTLGEYTGIIHDSVNENMFYCFSNGVCTKYEITYPVATNWVLANFTGASPVYTFASSVWGGASNSWPIGQYAQFGAERVYNMGTDHPGYTDSDIYSFSSVSPYAMAQSMMGISYFTDTPYPPAFQYPGYPEQTAALVQLSGYAGYFIYLGTHMSTITNALDTLAWNSNVQAIKTAVIGVSVVDPDAITSGEATAIVQSLRDLLLTF